jgi:hypothetical protein
MSGAFPDVIDRTRRVTLGGVRTKSERLLVEINTQSLSDIRAYLREITTTVTAQQIALGNPPSLLEVDGRTAKQVDAVQKKTVVVYGTVLAQSAMREVEVALAAAIQRSTRAHSGRLSNIGGSWSWLYLPVQGAPRTVTSATALPSFGPGDRLVLLPRDVPYATLVNRNVARSGRANVAPRRGKSPAKSRQNRGFMFHAADTVRRRPVFKQFRVRVVFSRAHPVAGEVMSRIGTAMLVITARRRPA